MTGYKAVRRFLSSPAGDRVAGLAFLMVFSPVCAVEIPKPKVSFSATQVLVSDGGTVEMPVFHKAGKTRLENTNQGQTIIIVQREDLGVVWTILPGNMYSEAPLDEQGSIRGPVDVELTELVEEGNETVNGYETTRYRFAHEAADGSSNNGKVWITSDNIMVKSVVQGQGAGQDFNITMENRDIVVGDQPDELFELPAGAQPLPAFPGSVSLPGGVMEDIPDPANSTNEEVRRQTGEALGEAYEEAFGEQ